MASRPFFWACYKHVVALSDELAREIEQLRRAELLRIAPQDHVGAMVACSNDYLGFAGSDVSRETLDLCAENTGAGASRLVSGNHAAILRLEAAICAWLEAPTALVFTSGYAANLGLLSALVGPDDLVVSDQYNHASIIDGCRLSKARVAVYPHLDVRAAAELVAQPARRKLLVSESYFSMEGTRAPLRELAALAQRSDAALIVDEAHAIGLFGPRGRGLAADVGVRPDATIGTLGKAVGCQGAFVAGSSELRQVLWNRARSFVFSTGLSPVLGALCQHRIAQVEAAVERRAHLRALCEEFRDRVQQHAIQLIGDPAGPIFPVRCGPAASALRASRRLLEAGYFVQAIRPPTVPRETSRLRIALRADMARADIAGLVSALRAALD